MKQGWLECVRQGLTAMAVGMVLAVQSEAQCPAPSTPDVEFLTSDSVTLGWTSFGNKPPNTFNVNLQFDTDPPNGLWVNLREQFLPAGSPLVTTFTGLLPGSKYRAAVIEYCTDYDGANSSGFTNFVTAGTGNATGCASPTAPSVDALTSTSAPQFWSSPNGDAGHAYQLLVQVDAAPIVLLGKIMPTTVEVGWFSPNNDTNHAFEVSLQFDFDPPNSSWISYAKQFVPAGAPKNVTFSNLVVNAQYRVALIEFCDGTNTGGAVVSPFVNFRTVGPCLAVPQITNSITAAALRLPAYNVVSTSGVERYVLYSVTTTPAVVQAGPAFMVS